MLTVVKKWMVERLLKLIRDRGYEVARPRFSETHEIDLRDILSASIPLDHGGEFTVLQIGANDGVTNDPIHHLVKSRGWKLLAVEPMPEPFERLCNTYRDYPNVTCVRCAVGSKDGEATIYSVDADSVHDRRHFSQLSTFSIDPIRKQWRSISKLETRVRQSSVNCLTVTSLLTAHGLRKLDMLQIDAEGYDYEIVKMAFLCGIFPSILAFEWTHLSLEAMSDCASELANNGYRWLVVKGDVVAIRFSSPKEKHV